MSSTQKLLRDFTVKPGEYLTQYYKRVDEDTYIRIFASDNGTSWYGYIKRPGTSEVFTTNKSHPREILTRIYRSLLERGMQMSKTIY